MQKWCSQIRYEVKGHVISFYLEPRLIDRHSKDNRALEEMICSSNKSYKS